MILSIICPTFNEEKYISKTIHSFLKQKYHSFELEILICDGMSTDSTRSIVEELSKKNPLIRLLDNPNRKTPFAFNIGLKAAKGEYIAILGAHTEYDDDYLQVCYDEVLKYKAVGASGRIITKCVENNWQAKLCEAVSLSSFGVSSGSFRVAKEGYVHTIGYPVFRKQVLIDLGGYNEQLYRNQDNDMNQRIIDAGHTLYLTWKTKCYYRPPEKIKNLLKYAYNNGFWNAKSFFIHRKSMRIHHFVPFLFISFICILIVLSIAEFFINNSYYSLVALISILLFHLSIGFIAALFAKKSNILLNLFLLPIIFLSFHFCYGWGTANGLLNLVKTKK